MRNPIPVPLRVALASLFICVSCSSDSDKNDVVTDSSLIEQGRFLLNEHKYAEALIPFQELHQRHPQEVFYLIEVAQINVSLGQKQKAIDLYKKGLETQPENLHLLSGLAFTYLFENEFVESRSLFERILAIDSLNADALAGLGFISFQEGKLDQAEDFYLKALQINPKHTTTLIYLGNLRIRQHRQDEARDIFDRLASDNPYNLDVRQGVETLNALKEPTTTIESSSAALQDEPLKEEMQPAAALNEQSQGYPESFDEEIYVQDEGADSTVDLLLEHAKNLRAQGRFKEALEVNLRAFAIDPDREIVNSELADAYLKDGKIDKSEVLFQSLVDENPNNTAAWVGLGEIQFTLGNEKEAEWLYLQALSIDPEYIPALFHLAQLQFINKNYLAASKTYKRILVYDPRNDQAKQGLQMVQTQPIIDRVRKAEDEQNDESLAKAYEELVDKSPCNVDYLVRLADIRRRQGQNKEALRLYLQANRLAPDRIDILDSLGYVYIDNENFEAAQEIFQKILDRDPLDVRGLTGVGRVAQIRKQWDIAEKYYQDALQVDPEAVRTLAFLGEMRLDQKRYPEAEQIFAKLEAKDPNEKWFKSSRRRARDQAAVDQAQGYTKAKDYEPAIAIYENLIQQSPDEVRYYIALGQVYAGMEEYDIAIEIYGNALLVDPKSKDAFKAIGFTYLYKAFEEDAVNGYLIWTCAFPFVGWDPKINAAMAREYMSVALELDPNDSELYAGLGRIALIYGCEDIAEDYYDIALSLNPQDTAALAYYGGLLWQQQKNVSALEVYRYQAYLLPEDGDAHESYINALNSTRPSASFGVFYHQENEWDHILHEKAAILQDYGLWMQAIFPVNEDVNVGGRVSDEHYILKSFINDTTSYSLDIQRAAVAFDFNYNPYLFIYGKFGIVYATQYKNAVFQAQRKWLIQPDLGAAYTRWNHRVVAETFSQADIVERSFETLRSKLFSGQGIRGLYEYDFGKRRFFGFTASTIWYEDWIHNQSQRGSVWLQVSPPQYWENIVFRYQFNFGRFNKLTQDYYTYQGQTTHVLSVELRKEWLDGDLEFITGYAHSWQRSFESGQVIAITPIAIFHYVHREINYAYGQVNYEINDCVNFSFRGDYSRDTFAYTTWNVQGQLNWSF